MNVRPDRLDAALQKSLAPVYLIAGSEPLIVEECRDAVLGVAHQQGFLERDVYHAEARFNWENLEGLASEQSLFAARKVIDIRIPNGKPGQEGGAFFTAWAKNLQPDRLLLVSCGAWDGAARKSRWAGALAAAGVAVEVWPVRPNELPDWIARRMQTAGLQAERDAVQLLAEHVEGNLLAARQEIEKLSLLHPGAFITVEHVRDAVGNNARFDAFRLGECLLAGRVADSLRVADGLHRTAVAIQAVTGALYYQLSQLDSVRVAIERGDSEATAFGKSRVFKMYQPLLRQALRRLDSRRVGRSFQALSLIDRQSKGQDGGDPWQTLNRMILDLGGESPVARGRRQRAP